MATLHYLWIDPWSIGYENLEVRWCFWCWLVNVLCDITVDVFLGCLYDPLLKDYTCGEHGECKQVKMSGKLFFSYCICRAGYEGEETCNQKCGKS